MINRIVLVGRTTRDPERRGNSSDKTTCIFTVAVDNRMKDKDGKTTTSFIPCVVFGAQADNVLKFVRKGNLVGVEGRLNQRTYLRQDGSKNSVFEVICDSVQFLESKKSTEVDNVEPEVPPFDDVAPAAEGTKNTDSLDLSVVDDLPF